MRKILLLAIAMLACCIAAKAQERLISGKVTSTEDGSTIPGVNVIVKGTTLGTVTSADGDYTLSVPVGATTLVFSFIGLQSQEVEIGALTVVNVALAADVTQLNEVVVTALGIEKQSKALGFSAKEVKNEELTVARTTNVVNALSGKVAGVRIAGSNGMTGSSSAIFIRGFTTFTGSNQPLFVVDGIPIINNGGINNDGGANATQTGVSTSNRAIDLNQDDIETMTVLKGPAAAVLYGSRAAAGAIIITTKKGSSKAGQKMSVEYAGSYNINEVNRWPDYQNQYANGTSLNAQGNPIAADFDPASDQANWGPLINGQRVRNFYSPSQRAVLGLPDSVTLRAYPDNLRDMFRTGYNMQNNVSLSGGNEKGNFFLSYNNLQDRGFLENNHLQRNSFRFTGNMNMSDRLSMGISANYINNESERSQIGNQLSNPLFRGWFLPRNYDLKNEPWQLPDGSQIYFNENTDNPFWTLRNNLYNDEINRIIGNVNLLYKFNEEMSVSYKLGTDAFVHRIKTVDGIGARGQANHNVQSAGAVGDRFIYNQETSSYLNFLYNKKIGDYNVTALLGNEISLRVGQDQGVVSNTTFTRGFDNVSDGLNFVPFGTRFRRNLVGVYADVQANYKEKIYFGFTGRNDWSSTFRRGNNSYFYPSVSGSVIITELFPSIKSDQVSYGKIKANWARVGREAPVFSTDNYFFNTNPSDGFGPQVVFPFLGRLGRTQGDVQGNPDLGPEFTRSFEVGTEWDLLDHHIRVDVTYFNTRSTDIILDVPIAAASGFASKTMNGGVLETNGIEITLGAVPVRRQYFKWSVDANWTRVRNNVIELAPGVTNIVIGGFTTAQARLEAGKEYGVIYANTLLKDDQGRIIVQPNGLPTIDTRGVQLVANPNPRWLAGLTNTFSYKNITASLLVDIRYGGDILSRVINDLRRTGSVAETAERPRFDANGQPVADYVIDGVQTDGSVNTVRITAQQYWSNLHSFNAPGMGVFDASWVRLREASIFYTLPSAWLGNTRIRKVEVGLNGRNLALWTRVPHIDPETNLTGASNAQGIEFNTMPNARSYGAVLKIMF